MGRRAKSPGPIRFWAYDALEQNNFSEALYRSRKAAALAPDLPLVMVNLGQFEEIAGHDEQALAAARATLTALDGSGRGKIIARSAAALRQQSLAKIAEDKGDYPAALAAYAAIQAAPDFEGTQWAATQMTAADLLLMHDPGAASGVHDLLGDRDMARKTNESYGWALINIAWPAYLRSAAMGDWRVALAHQTDVQQSLQGGVLGPSSSFYVTAMAMTGNIRGAWHEAARMALDCYGCLRARAQIDAVSGNSGGAAYWFARAVALAPSLPFAEEEWGRMLLAHGDGAGAAAKFESAHRKAPKYADALEGWGEALMAANRSDLALAKFQEAQKFTPKWGRLHLKWGQALRYAGRGDKAREQFTIAASLALAPADQRALAAARRD